LVDIVCATTVIGIVFLLSYAYASRVGSNLWYLADMVRGAEIALTVVVVVTIVALVAIYWRRHKIRVARIKIKQQQREVRRREITRRQQPVANESRGSV
jgi:membrane protein YdbS with pleckstrin-like domain